MSELKLYLEKKNGCTRGRLVVGKRKERVKKITDLYIFTTGKDRSEGVEGVTSEESYFLKVYMYEFMSR